MVRAIDADFEELKKFLTAYRLDAIVKNKSQLSAVKAAHKVYLAFLQLWSICLDKATKGQLTLFGHAISATSIEFCHLREAVSDTASSLFCCLHGAYKPGNMALRSSIENFLRFASGPFDNDASTTTSVYDLFDIAKKTTPFSGQRRQYLEQLRTSYGELCKYSHSASSAHMAGIHAFEYFPGFDEAAFHAWIKLAKPCLSAMTTVAALGHPPLYLDAHYSSRDLLDQLIPRSEQLKIRQGSR